MTPMNAEQRAISDKERPDAKCARMGEGGCFGEMQVSHPFGRKIQERWMWIWCCKTHHMGELKNEQIGRLHAYRQATDDMIKKTFPKNWQEKLHDRKWLENKYKNIL